MRGITCRNGLVWQGRRARFVFVAAICLGSMMTSARGGSLDAPAGPNSAASAMFTLEDIYNVLDTHTTNVTKRTSFKEPTAGPTSGTMHTLNDIMTLAKRAPIRKTGQTNAFVVGDDGWYSTNLGVAWPNPRFTVGTGVNGTNCVVDNLTGLMWARNANLAKNAAFNTSWSSVDGTCTWYQAFDVITNSAGPVNGANGGAGYGGYSDWRLPNLCELLSLQAWQYSKPTLCNTAGTGQWTANNPFVDFQTTKYYWSSTTSTNSPGNAWIVDLYTGSDGSVNKTSAYCVWPVRGGQ